MKTLLYITTISLILSICSPGYSESITSEYTANSIKVINNSATMFEHDSGWFTTISSAVGSEGIPNQISIGDKITVNEKTVIANLIIVTVVNEDMKWNGKIIARRGDISCVIASSEENIPSDEDRDRLWISVKKCQPLR